MPWVVGAWRGVALLLCYHLCTRQAAAGRSSARTHKDTQHQGSMVELYGHAVHPIQMHAYERFHASWTRPLWLNVFKFCRVSMWKYHQQTSDWVYRGYQSFWLNFMCENLPDTGDTDPCHYLLPRSKDFHQDQRLDVSPVMQLLGRELHALTDLGECALRTAILVGDALAQLRSQLVTIAKHCELLDSLLGDEELSGVEEPAHDHRDVDKEFARQSLWVVAA